MKRRGYSTVEAEATVYHDDIVEDIDDSVLIAELKRRQKTPPANTLEDVLHLLYQHSAQEAIVYLERMLCPSRELSLATYEKAKQTRDPQTGRPMIQ